MFRFIPRRLSCVGLLLALPLAGLASETPDPAALQRIIEAAETDIRPPEALAVYPEIRQGTEGTLVVREGDLEFTEKLTLDRKATAGGQLVLRFGSDNLRGEHSTDIISGDPESGLLRRVRLRPDGRIERLKGVVAFKPAPAERADAFMPLDRQQILWFGEVEHRGKPTGETVAALETISRFDGEHFESRTLSLSHQTLKDGQVVRREIFTFDEMHEKEGAPPDEEATPDENSSPGLLGRLKSWLGGKEKQAAVPVPGEAEPEVYEFEDLNFRFTHPEGRYVKMDAEAVSPDAQLALLQSQPSRMLMIIAEEFGVNARINLDGLTQIVRTNMLSINPAVKLGEIEELERDGIPHRRFTSEAPVQGGKTGRWCHLVSIRQGFAYQLVLFTLDPRKADLAREIELLADNFAVLDPNRVGRSPTMTAAPRWDAPAYGITIDTESFPSVLWDPQDLRANFPAAAFGVVTLDGGGMFAVPVDITRMDPDPQLLGLVLRSLAGLGPETEGLRVEPHSQGPATGTRATATYAFQGQTYTHQVRVLRQGDRAVAVAAYSPGEGSATLRKVGAMLDVAEFSEPTGEPTGTAAVQADIANQFGLVLHGRGEPRGAISFYQEARRRDPEKPVYGHNLLQAYHDAALFEQGLREAEDLLEEADDPALPLLRAWQASFLAADGRHADSIAVYDRLFGEAWRNDDHFLTYLQILASAEPPERTVEAVDAYIERHGIEALRVLRWRRQAYTQAGRWEEALEIARRLSEQHPDDGSLRFELVSALIDAGRGADAIELLDTGGFGTTAEAELLHQRGRALNLGRQYVKAKEQLERALELAPQRPDIQGELDLAAAMLGQGDQGSIRQPLDAVAVPTALTKALDGLSTDGHPEGFPSRIDSSITGIHLVRGHPVRRTEYREVTILTRAGLEEYRNIRFTFDPSYERAFVNRLDVIGPDGTVKASGNPADYYVSSGTGGLTMATGERTVTAPVPGLSVGDRIRHAYTVESRAPLEDPPFERFLFASMAPSGPRAVFITGDLDGLRGEFLHGDALEQHGEGFHCWLVAEPPRFEPEELLPDLDHFLPSLAIGPSSGDWETIGRDYLADLEDRLAASPGIKERAAAFASEHPDPAERLKMILRFVQSEINYQAIEFGRRARIPNRAEDCLSDRYGDCKDHSLLAHLLLKEAGIESQLVLVNTGSRIHPGLPSLDQFNHMIVRVGDRKEGRFFDCTMEHRDPAAGPGSVLSGRRCLVLHQEGPALETIPTRDPARNRVTTGREVCYDLEKNEFVVKETTRFEGEQAEWVRSYLSSADRSQYADVFTRLLGSDHRLTIDEVAIEGLGAAEPHCETTLHYRISSALHRDGDRLTGRLPAVWEELFFKTGASAKRKAPFELRFGYSLESSCSFEWKGDPRLEVTPSWKASTTTHPWGDWRVEPEAGGLKSRLSIRPGVYPAGKFAEYRSDQSDYLRSLQGRLSVESGGAE